MPATGTVAVSDALLEAGAVRVGNHHSTPVESARQLQRMGVAFDRTWTVATTVRDVPRWFESIFRKGWHTAVRFDCICLEWIHRFEKSEPHFPLFNREIYWKYPPFATDIWQQESLEEDMNATLARLGAPPLTLKRVNVSSPPVPRWTPEAERYVGECYHSKFTRTLVPA